ncbi:MAG: permease prefix domain 1-containing protein, partial [Paraclostridium sp.]|uniref:permease prefix domain 1-containing protein n=1 Tax=Paraclostridium sp. TaxID=2023273 RepID=UPI003F32B22B
MNEKIKRYIDSLFEKAPKNRKTYELKEELLSNVNEKYNDLLDMGLDENQAYSKAVENIGKIDELIEASRDYSKEEIEYRKKYAKRHSLAIMLYILCPVPVLLLGDRGYSQDRIGVILLLLMIAVATMILIYNGSDKPTASRIDDDLYNKFISWKDETSKEILVERRVQSIVNSLVLVIYFIVS